MKVFVVGTGKLATELVLQMKLPDPLTVRAWADRHVDEGTSIVVHAGSGRELAEAAAFCRATRSPLIELSTGSALEGSAPTFPVVLCPNTNILMLKFMGMLERSGSLFQGCRITLTESHQAGKTSVPGTAVAMAAALGLSGADVVSVRDPEVQKGTFLIPEEHLGRHAFHRIVIDDGVCSVQMETRVGGDAPYAEGVGRIVQTVHEHAAMLEGRVHPIHEFIERGWI